MVGWRQADDDEINLIEVATYIKGVDYLPDKSVIGRSKWWN